MEYKLNVSVSDLIKEYNFRHKVGNEQDIRKAYNYAAEKHANKSRGTGEPYINHPLRTAKYIAEWGFESDVVMAALLHDVVEDCNTPLSEIEDQFGTNVADIVDAVTQLSDKDFEDQTLSKAQIDLRSDVRLQKKMSEKALYIKIADRIDNLNTLSGVKESKRIPKAEHTREIIIPMAKQQKAYRFVDILEELCFETEHADKYKDIKKQYKSLCAENDKTCQESLETLSRVFDPNRNNETKELDIAHHYIVNFDYMERTCVSLDRQVSSGAENIIDDWQRLLSKDNTALYDIVLVVSDELSEKYSSIDSNEVFFQYFERSLSHKGFYLLDYCTTFFDDIGYFLISDEMDNMYRVFVNTETENLRYNYGNIIDKNNVFALTNVNEVEPRDSYNDFIRVFKDNGSAMQIDKGSTVLDFAFYLHNELGYHFSYAMLDEDKTHLPATTRLNEGDRITIVADKMITPDISWFEYVKTSKATHQLVRFFSDPDNLAALLSRLNASKGR